MFPGEPGREARHFRSLGYKPGTEGRIEIPKPSLGTSSVAPKEIPEIPPLGGLK